MSESKEQAIEKVRQAIFELGYDAVRLAKMRRSVKVQRDEIRAFEAGHQHRAMLAMLADDALPPLLTQDDPPT